MTPSLAPVWKNQSRQAFGALGAIKAGSGRKLVLLHGVGLRAEAWGGQIKGLGARFEITAPDMPGHGGDASRSFPSDIRGYTDLVAAALQEPSDIAGHSMGAMIALDLAIRFPHKVRSVIAMNAIFERSVHASQAVQARARDILKGGRPDAEPTLTRWFGSEQSEPRRACAAWLETVDLQGYGNAYSVFAHQNGPERSDISDLSVPALFITGRLEPNSTPEMSGEMARLAPQGVVKIIEDAAHMMPMTHSDEVNEALVEFLDDLA